jgi:hypothetical protein
LDGHVPHEGDGTVRDRRRVNRRVAQGIRVLRYDYTDISTHSCATASQVGAALAARGWPGKLRRCGSDCTLPATDSD